jgi:hypothetical protein
MLESNFEDFHTSARVLLEAEVGQELLYKKNKMKKLKLIMVINF